MKAIYFLFWLAVIVILKLTIGFTIQSTLLQVENLGIREVPFTGAVPVYKNYSHKWMPKKNRLVMSAFGRINKCVLWWTLINVKWTNSKLSCGQMENWQNRSLFCCPVKGHVFVDLHIKDKLCCQESIFMHVVSGEERA